MTGSSTGSPTGSPTGSSAWKQARAGWAPLVAAGLVACRRCGQAIAPGTEWDLGHPDETPHATHGSGPEVIAACRPEHRGRCNRGVGAAAVRAAAQAGRVVAAPPGRLW